MKKLLEIYLFSILMVFWAVGSAFAISLGTDITISDGGFSGSDWWSDREDQEVEPNCVANQSWDLEGFFLDGTTLTMVGGFDFKNGKTGNGILFESGDVFIDTNGDAQYGSGNTGSGSGYSVVNNNFGYEYALSLDFTNSQYTVHSLDSSSTVSVYYGQNDESNPWKWNDGGTTFVGTGGFTYHTGLSNVDVDGLLGDTHNAVAIDLGYLIGLGANLDDFTTHFTIECGNDNLMGNGSVPVPEPSTILLIGTGLLGMIAFGRKRFNKKA